MPANPSTAPRNRQRTEFGDFQTPGPLADEVCRTLLRMNVRPSSVLEPSCGQGQLLSAAAGVFTNAIRLTGFDINADYVATAAARLRELRPSDQIRIETADFFRMNWAECLQTLKDPLLILGNPPWVTNSTLGCFDSTNLPVKSNSGRLPGIRALTGSSNFDISEWMIREMLGWMTGRTATLAMLCKTSVARRILHRGWIDQSAWQRTAMFRIDAARHFAAAVDACLLVIQHTPSNRTSEPVADVYDDLSAVLPASTLGLRGNRLVPDTAAFDRTRSLEGSNPVSWRSGIKHDCARIVELRREGSLFRNGLGELTDLEPDFVFPMLKGSSVATGRIPDNRWMLVTQRDLKDDTAGIETRAPRTWQYLLRHQAAFDRRRSSIYRGRPRFAMFGLGSYTFAPWKVAVSALYKKPVFRTIGPQEGRPVVLDDTCSFLPCESETQARDLCQRLNSPMVRDYLAARVFADSKRPYTIEILQGLDLSRIVPDTDQHPTSPA